jgi:hypothetical protein
LSGEAGGTQVEPCETAAGAGGAGGALAEAGALAARALGAAGELCVLEVDHAGVEVGVHVRAPEIFARGSEEPASGLDVRRRPR